MKCHKCPITKECAEIGLQIKDDTGTPKKACPLLWAISVANFVLQKEEKKETTK
jgi:hypothetical protein